MPRHISSPDHLPLTDTLDRLRAALRDRYVIERELGRGGMATVYLAHDLKHDRRVALKVLHPELGAMLGPERFLREIRTTARLQHPHILTVHDSGEAAGQLWYTMPFIRGESLRDRLRREAQLAVEVAVDLARQIALALDYAHREGVIHRELKPENILLSDQQALVADFGVAKALAAGHEGPLTETGMSVGTPAYMSPEQASAGQVDGRSDVYALGCVLYEMLAGEPPFTGLTPQAVLAKRLLEPVPHVRTLRESVPEPLEQAISRALAKAPADRFATAGEFAQALAQAHPAPATTTSPAAPQRAIRSRVPVGRLTTLALVVLVSVGVLLAWLRSRAEPETAGPTRLAVLPFENLGDSADAYFADGVANDLRTKLSQVRGLAVIARGSSNEYKRTTKTQQQIARELGVNYLLMDNTTDNRQLATIYTSSPLPRPTTLRWLGRPHRRRFEEPRTCRSRGDPRKSLLGHARASPTRVRGAQSQIFALCRIGSKPGGIRGGERLQSRAPEVPQGLRSYGAA